MARKRNTRAAAIAVAAAAAVVAVPQAGAAADPSPAGIPKLTAQGVAGLAAPGRTKQVAVSATAQSTLAEHGIAADATSPVATIMETGTDPFRSQQWGLDAVKSPAANTASTGTGVTVAVIDSGVAKVQDLSGKILTGKDFLATGDGTNDQNGHGTGIASIIAATTNNAYGMAGVAPDVKILPVRVCDANGSCPMDSVAAGVLWAVDNGAQVINMSLGGGSTPALTSAIAYAAAHQVFVAAAAGNSAESGNPVMYPAGYDSVMAVGAVDSGKARASFSEFGPQVDIAAPGVGVVQAAPGEKWVLASGTSEASPHVAAAAALAKSYKPSITVGGMIVAMANSATDIGDQGRDDQFGSGLLDTSKLLATLGATVTTPAPAAPVPSAPATKAPVVQSLSPAMGSADGGTSVSITGTGFTSLDRDDPNAVLFGDVPAASFVVESATKITAVAPAGSGQVVVKAVNSVGASTGATKFSYRTPLGAEFDDGIVAKPSGGTIIPVTVTGGTAGATAKDFTAEKITAKLGAVAAPVAWVDETHLKITAPATTNANSVSLQLFHDGVPGPVSTSAVNYPPAVSVVSPSKVSGAGGSTVTITGAGFSGVDPSDPAGVTFGGVNADSFTVVSPTKITAVVPAGDNGPAAVNVRTSGGVSPDSAAARVTYRSVLGLTVPQDAAAKASGGTVLTLEVTGGTIGADARAFTAENIAVMNGKNRLTTAWADESHVKVTLPPSTADYVDVTVSHDGYPGDAARIPYVRLITSMSAVSDTVAGGKKVTIKLAGTDLANASDFMFGDNAADCAKQGTGTAITFVCTAPPASAAGPTWVSFAAGSGTQSRFTAASTFSYTDIG